MLSIIAKLKPQRLFVSNSILGQAKNYDAKVMSSMSTNHSVKQVLDDKTLATEPLQPDKLFSRLEIEIKSAEPAVLKSFSWFATTAAKHLGIEVGECWSQRKPNHDRLTLLKSVHIYKKHRVQYEVRTYFHFMTFNKLTGSTLDTFLEYIQRNLPEGVAMKCTKAELQELPEHLRELPKSVDPTGI